MKLFKTVVIDPPWPGPGSCPTFKNSRSSVFLPYSTMTGVQLASMELPAATDAQLFLWATSRSIGDAFLLHQLWGFQYRGLFVWKKPGLGMGRHIRHQCEFLLYGARPKGKLIEPKALPRQFQEWPNPRRHSEKPGQAYDMIRAISDSPRIDMFARQKRPGFRAWGNEVT